MTDIDLGTHTRDIEAVLMCERIREALVVGHSYAGAVLVGLGVEATERIACVILLDAVVPKDGESMHEMYAQVADGLPIAAERADALGLEICDLAVPHDPMRSHPAQLADWLARAAGSPMPLSGGDANPS